jgi:hypothetical protein
MLGGDGKSSLKRRNRWSRIIALSRHEKKTQNEKPQKKSNVLQTTLAPVRQYLQASVVPVLLAGLTELASAQPADPVAWLAQYLIDNNPRNKKGGDGEGEGGGGGADEKMGEEREDKGEGEESK